MIACDNLFDSLDTQGFDRIGRFVLEPGLVVGKMFADHLPLLKRQAFLFAQQRFNHLFF